MLLWGKVVEGGKGYMVRCPNKQAHAHGDRTPSLSVSEGKIGVLLLYCHAGCEHAEVRAALGLPPPRRAKATGRIVTAQEMAEWLTARARCRNRAELIAFDNRHRPGRPLRR